MSSTRSVEFIFDFGSPNAYLAYRALPAVLAPSGAPLHITPCLLGGIFKATGNQSPATAFAEVKGKLAYQRLEMKRFMARHGIEAFRFNPHFPINTLLVMRGLIAADGFDDTEIRLLDDGMIEVTSDDNRYRLPARIQSADAAKSPPAP